MSKLLSYYLKRDKWILLAMAILPLLASVVLTYEIGPIINFMAIYVTFIVATLMLCYRDYKRFYGEYSSFFSGLPLTGKEIVGGRIIWFILVNMWQLVIILVKGIEVYLRMLRDISVSTEVKTELMPYLQQVPTSVYVIGVLLILTSVIMGACSWVFVVSVGSEKIFRRYGIGGPILLYIALQFVYGIGSSLFIDFLSGHFLDYYKGSGAVNPDAAIASVARMVHVIGGAYLVIMAIVSVILYLRSVYSHERKLSAQ